MPGLLVTPTDAHATAKLNYSLPPAPGTRLYNYVESPPEGVPRSNIETEVKEVNVTDVRPFFDPITGESEKIGLDKTGFQVVPDFQTVLNEDDFLEDDADDKKIKEVYYKEVEEQLKKATGASRVFIFDHTIRRRSPAPSDSAVTQASAVIRGQPVARTHIDQSAKAGAARVYHHLPDEADKLSKGRVQIINFWRPIRGPVQDAPLAVADFFSIDPDTDVIPTRHIYPDRDGETLSVAYSPNHRWFFVSDQQPNEVLLIKCYDSKAWDRENNKLGKGGIASLTPHTAFVDPRYDGKAGVKLRQSIEVRALVFHETE